MKGKKSGLSTEGSATAAPQADRTALTRGSTGAAVGASPSTDDVHFSQLVRNLRSLAADSPERQAKIEQLARAYASSSYVVDAHATAEAIIADASKG